MREETSKQDTAFFRAVYEAARWSFACVAIFSFFVNLLLLAIPLYMLQIFERVLPTYSSETLLYMTLITIVALMVYGALEMFRAQILIVVGRWFEQKYSPQVIRQVPDEVVRQNSAAIYRLKDIAKIRGFLMSPALLVFFDFPWTPVFIVVIFLLHPALGVFSLVGALLLFGLGIFVYISTQKLQEEALKSGTQTQRHMTQALKNSESIIAMGMMSKILDAWFADNERSLSEQTLVSHQTSTYRSITKSLRLILQLGILGLGAYLVLIQQVTPGAMIAASILLSRALAPVEQAVSSWKATMEAKEAYLNLKNYFLFATTRGQRMSLPTPKGKLVFEKVYVRLPNTPKYILNNIHFSLEPGETLVIYGPSAAGKTTLARVAMGIIKPDIGHARLDGADIYEWNRDEFGDHVGYLSQSFELFEGTIKSNIARMGVADPEKVVEAAQRAGVHDMILSLTEGYDTLLGDTVRHLSGGQLQRVALARAFYNQPKLVVLDEPNSNLDEPGFAALMNCLAQAKKDGITLVVITHASGLFKLADKLMILQEGSIFIYDNRDTVVSKLNEVRLAQEKEKQRGSHPPQEGRHT